MIISVSRRTDIPAYFSEWLVNKIKEKSVSVKNPMNPQQIRKVNLSPEAVDCIVFWTKNPKPLIERLDEFSDYTYYFQFTLNPYEQDIETNLPNKNEIIETFKKLSDKITPVKYNIGNARCIDDRLISKLTGFYLQVGKDKNQRLACGCVASADIGEYNTCQNGCLYCYANVSQKKERQIVT